jgi:hypothetical protein
MDNEAKDQIRVIAYEIFDWTAKYIAECGRNQVFLEELMTGSVLITVLGLKDMVYRQASCSSCI